MPERGQLGHVRTLAVTQSERTRERRQHRGRRVAVAPLFQAREVVDAHAGERGDLFASQARGTAPAVVDQADVARGSDSRRARR